MPNWLTRWFGNRGAVSSGADAPPPRAVPRALARPTAAQTASPEQRVRPLKAAEVAFLLGVIDPPKQETADHLGADDRAFVAGIQRRLRQRELELPVLPEMALRLSKMFREGAPVSEFASVINTDPSLVVEVLKTANSAFYAGGGTLTSLQDAIVRIGLDRLQSVLMVAHLRGKIFKPGPFQAEADLLLDLALPVGRLSTKLASVNHQPADVCFMRGALLHVEHLVILSATGAASRDVKRAIMPTPHGLHQAFVRSGRAIREALAIKWNLRDLLLGGETEPGVAEEYERIRHAVIARWLRLPLPDQPSCDEGFAAAVADIAPRVPAPEQPAADEPPTRLAS